MKLVIRLPQKGLEAHVKCFRPGGQEVDVARIEIEPIFYQPQQKVPILYAEALIENEEADEEPETIQRFSLAVSGATGRTHLVDRSKQVKPSFEVKSAKKGKSKKTETPETIPSAEELQPTIDLPDQI